MRKKRHTNLSGLAWQRRQPPTCLPFFLEVLGDQFDRVVLHVGGDDVRKADVAPLRGSAAPPEVLHGCVEDQVVGLGGDQRVVSPGCSPSTTPAPV